MNIFVYEPDPWRFEDVQQQVHDTVLKVDRPSLIRLPSKTEIVGIANDVATGRSLPARAVLINNPYLLGQGEQPASWPVGPVEALAAQLVRRAGSHGVHPTDPDASIGQKLGTVNTLLAETQLPFTSIIDLTDGEPISGADMRKDQVGSWLMDLVQGNYLTPDVAVAPAP